MQTMHSVWWSSARRYNWLAWGRSGKRRVAIGLCVLLGIVGLCTSPASAQTVTAFQGGHLGWDQDGPDLASISAYTYKAYADTATTGTTLTGVSCATTPTAQTFACQVAFPAFTPGAHSLTITATNVAGEGLKSTAFAFTMVLLPTAPKNLRVTP